MNQATVEFSFVHESATVPTKANFSDAGYDLRSVEETIIHPNHIQPIKTGIVLAIPENYGGFILPRSGLAIKEGITVANSPGLIDAGYRGEIIVGLINHSTYAYRVEVGERIAQIVFLHVPSFYFTRNDKIIVEETERNTGGLGSTGKQ